MSGVPSFEQGTRGKNHTEIFRARMEGNMTGDDDPRFARYNQRMVEASTQYVPQAGESLRHDYMTPTVGDVKKRRAVQKLTST